MRLKWFNSKAAPQPVDFTASESAVRGLIASGKHKTALDQAKDLHKAHKTPAAEALLLDAYAARIQSLIEQGLSVEATALVNLVGERYPAAKDRLATLTAANLARSGKLDELLAPLNDPALSPERRANIEQAILEGVSDPALIAQCPALPADHPLRQAAAAIQRAFVAVTKGLVSDDVLALPEVSRRSPLAPWKMLLSAMASFYRLDADACRGYLAQIPPASAPARLRPVLDAMNYAMGESESLTPAGRELLSQVKGNADTLKHAASELDEAIADGLDDDIARAIRRLVTECRRTAPSHLDRLKQYISILTAREDFDVKIVNSAMGGPARQDADFNRMLANALEHDDELVSSCVAWHDFRLRAVEEGWFPEGGPEVAAIYVHIARLLRDVAPWDLHQIKAISARMKVTSEDTYFLNAEALYERASILDPHPTVFSQWLESAKMQKGPAARQVAEKWRQARPRDIEPLLFLISDFEKRNAFPSALQHLAEAEEIDGVNPEVRKARLRLMTANFFKQIQPKKIPPAATKTLAAISELPQTRQGDRPAFVQALHYVLAMRKEDHAEAERHRAEIERLLGSAAAASLLIYNVVGGPKRVPTAMPDLPKSDRAAVPIVLARVAALVRDVELVFAAPFAWVQEAAKQFASLRNSLDIPQLRDLGECAMLHGVVEFAYNISAEGLSRGVTAEAEFLLFRARALRSRNHDRAMVLALTAASLARQRHEFDLSAKAVEFLDEMFKQDINKLTPAQIEQVLKTEKAETSFPKTGGGPSYRDLLSRWCDCPACRQARGEHPIPFDADEGEDDEFDEEEDDPFLGTDFELPPGLPIPKGMPPAVAKMLFASMMEGMSRGETPDETFDRMQREMGMGGPPPKKGKKKR